MADLNLSHKANSQIFKKLIQDSASVISTSL